MAEPAASSVVSLLGSRRTDCSEDRQICFPTVTVNSITFLEVGSGTTAQKESWVLLFCLSRPLPDPWDSNLHSQNSLFTVWSKLAVLCPASASREPVSWDRTPFSWRSQPLFKVGPDSEVRGKFAVVSQAQQYQQQGQGRGWQHSHVVQSCCGCMSSPVPMCLPLENGYKTFSATLMALAVFYWTPI